jgi:excisionase family DNA binding protein
MAQEADLLTTGEAGRELSVTDETIRRWIADGRLPAITLPSGQFRIRREHVAAILAGKAGAV